MIENKTKEIMIKAARSAGSYAGERAGRYDSLERKRGFTDLVTDVDKTCEKIIIDIIKGAFSEDDILAEESGESITGSPRRWVIDPLDGTTNFTHGFPFFCCSVALEEKGRLVAGAVYEPMRDELFSAFEGEGAELNGQKISVSQKRSLEESLLGTGFAYDVSGKVDNIKYFKKVIAAAQAVRRPGAAALDLCYVACGRYEGFWELGLAPWDTAAGSIILKEAGGVTTRLDGENHMIEDKQIVATNGLIHKALLDTLNS